MSDWDDTPSDIQTSATALGGMDVCDRAETLKSNDNFNKRDNFKRNNEDVQQDGGQRRRRNNGDGDTNFTNQNDNRGDNQQRRRTFDTNGDSNNQYRRNNDNNDNQNGDSNYQRRRSDFQNDGNQNFNKRNDQDGQDNQGGYRRRTFNNDQNNDQASNQDGGYQRRRNNDQNDNQNTGDSNQDGGYQPRRRNFNNDQANNQDGQDGGNQPRRRNFNNDQNDQASNQDGGYQRRRNNDQNENQNTGDSNQDGGYQPRRRNFNNDQTNNQDGQDGGNQPRRRNFNNDQNNDQASNQDGGYQRRRNNDQDNNQDGQDGGNQPRRRNFNNDQNNDQNGNSEGGNQRRRRDQNNESQDCNPRAETIQTEDGEPPKERYIPRRYNKEDEDLFDMIDTGINFAKYANIPVQVSGENIPDPIQSFKEIAKHDSIIQAIKKSNYKTLTPIQKYGISIVKHGRDLMASAQTGSGKTMAFLLPIVQALVDDPESSDFGDTCSPQCLIMTPTRELAIQIYEQALKLTYKNDIKSCVVYGGANFGDQRNRISYGANIIVATPGRCNHFLEQNMIKLNKLKYFVLDEADRMIDQGFMPIVKKVFREFDMPEDKQTLMFSATFPYEVQNLAQEFLKKDYVFLSVGILGSANDDVEQQILNLPPKAKKKKIVEILKEIYGQDTRVLVFTEKKKTCDFLASVLCENDFKTTSIHGDRFQSQREEALRTFKRGETPVMVATSVAARGLDIKGITHVINYDLPSEIEEYIHRIGRTGRVGNSGKAISFWNDEDNVAIAPALLKVLQEAKQEIPDFLRAYDGASSYGRDDGVDHRNESTQNENFETRQDNYQPATENAAQDASDDW